jgi:hypothetical protein
MVWMLIYWSMSLNLSQHTDLLTMVLFYNIQLEFFFQHLRRPGQRQMSFRIQFHITIVSVRRSAIFFAAKSTVYNPGQWNLACLCSLHRKQNTIDSRGVVKKLMSQQRFLHWQVWPAAALGKETLNAGATRSCWLQKSAKNSKCCKNKIWRSSMMPIDNIN